MKRKSIYITKSFQETQFHIGGYGLQFERYFSLEYFPYGQFHAYITPTTPRSQPIEYILGFHNQGQYAICYEQCSAVSSVQLLLFIAMC